MEMSDDPTARLTDDILADIISRVPYKSTCRCRCVSTRWRDIISHPDHREKMPQTLAGFFYESYNSNRFTNVSGSTEPLVDPSLSFLPKYESIDVLDCCHGLLLCRCKKPTDPKTLDYVVCNPATEKWVVVPATKWSSKVGSARLGFEPDVSFHFHVFEFVPAYVFWEKSEEFPYANGCVKEMGIYSSKTGIWIHKDVIASTGGSFIPMDSSIFLRGTLYLTILSDWIAAVDVEGVKWRFIPTPVAPYEEDSPNGIYLSQGQLCLAHEGDSELSIWILQDYTSGNWTLKHNVSCQQLFGEFFSVIGNDYNVISIHPQDNVVFIVCQHEKTLISYDMDSGKLCFIRQLGWDCFSPFIPYVPLFSKSLADGN